MGTDDDGDLTRIENLEAFEHLDDEDDEDFESLLESDSASSDDEILDGPTDPSIQLDDDFGNYEDDSSDQEDSDDQFSSEFENSNDDFNSNFDSDTTFEDSDDNFSEDFSNSEEEPFDEETSFDESEDDFSDSLEDQNDEQTFDEPTQVTETEIQGESLQELTEDNDTPIDKEEDPVQPTPQETPVPTPEPAPAPAVSQTPENYRDIQQFAKSVRIGNLGVEGNPPFSIIIKNIQFTEDVEDILILLKEFKVIDPAREEEVKQSLQRGSLLIPRLGEFSAITLCHRLRRFNVTLLMGLTEQINPAMSYSSHDKGTVNKNSVFNNKKENFIPPVEKLTTEDILVSTANSLENFEIIKYIGVVTEFEIVEKEILLSDHEELLKDVLANDTKAYHTENWPTSLAYTYEQLIEKCKIKAIDKGANALIGITFQLSPLIVDEKDSLKSKYQIMCTGSMVWVNKN